MKKQAISFLVFTLLASTFFFSCRKDKQKQYGNMSYDSVQVDKTAYLVDDPNSPNCSLTINFTYPTEAEDTVLRNIVNETLISQCFGNEYAGLTPEVAVDSFKNVYIREYRKDLLPLYEEEFKNAKGDRNVAGWYSYYLTVEARPIESNPDYLVYKHFINEFRGGAHGTYATFFLNFDLKTRKLIKLNDIFQPGYEKPLTDLLLNHLMQKTGTASIEELQEKAYLLITEMYPSDNFYMSKNGIVFYYNIYEIAPYSSGTTELTLSYDEVKTLLKP